MTCIHFVSFTEVKRARNVDRRGTQKNGKITLIVSEAKITIRIWWFDRKGYVLSVHLNFGTFILSDVCPTIFIYFKIKYWQSFILAFFLPRSPMKPK